MCILGRTSDRTLVAGAQAEELARAHPGGEVGGGACAPTGGCSQSSHSSHSGAAPPSTCAASRSCCSSSGGRGGRYSVTNQVHFSGRFSTGSGVVPFSLQRAPVLSQYIVAPGFRPDFAIFNSAFRTFAFASIGPRVSSWGKCLRSVTTEPSPRRVAICSCFN